MDRADKENGREFWGELTERDQLEDLGMNIKVTCYTHLLLPCQDDDIHTVYIQFFYILHLHFICILNFNIYFKPCNFNI